MTEQLAIHPIAAIFPVMAADELERLADDIQANGLREPVTLYEGKILDGRNRAMACSLRGIELQTREFHGSSSEALALVWSKNRVRRHLTSSQAAVAEARRARFCAEYAAEIAKIKADARQRQRAGGKLAGRGRPMRLKPIVTNLGSNPNDRKTNAIRAKSSGTNRTYVAEAEKLLAEAPELAKEVAAGKLTIPQAIAELRRRQKRAELKVKANTTAVADPDWEIRHGDCLTILPSLSEKARLVFADPPYNIGINYGEGQAADRLDDDAYLAWVEKWLTACRDLLTADGSLWVLIGDEYAAEYVVMLKRLGLKIRSWIKWFETFGVNCANNFNRCSRHLLYCVRDPQNFVFNTEAVTRPSDRQLKYQDKRANPGGKIWDNVWGINPPIPRLTGTCKERVPDFPTQLPLALLEPIVLCASEPGDLVVDPFNGSGSSGVAAIRNNRRYFGIEKSAEFTKISRMRLAATGLLLPTSASH